MLYWQSVEGHWYYFHDFAPAVFHHFITFYKTSYKTYPTSEWQNLVKQANTGETLSIDGHGAVQKPKYGEENLRVQTLRYRVVKYTLNDTVIDWLRKNVQCGQKEAQWGTYLSTGIKLNMGFARRQDALKFLMCWAETIETQQYEIKHVFPAREIR